jgi:fatty-acyl-CoA synthase
MTIHSATSQILSPLLFLERSASVYPHRAACIYNGAVTTYAQLYDRVRRQAAALRGAGVEAGDRVAFLLPNLPSMLEANYGPMGIGAVLVALNIRLSPREIAYILNHSGSKVLVFDSELGDTVRQLRDECPGVETYVQVRDTAPLADGIPGPEYEQWLSGVEPLDHLPGPATELDTVTINYTSGTTGMPKGVEYTPRGAYLNAIGEAMEMGMTWRSIYLWTLPMFHANGWCFTWAVTAVGGTHVCLRRVDPAEVYRLIREESVTHLCAAPTVLTGLYAAPEAASADLTGLTIMTAGAPPAPQVIRTIEGMGAYIIHVYGLTETYGPCTVSAPQPEWDDMTPDDVARIKARQGVLYMVYGVGLRVVDEDMQDVPRDAQTMGEVVMQGDAVMKGYYDDTEATDEAFRGGWFHSGDLAVWHPDGYIELQDRSKDIIISGGENISSQEVEKVIMEHPAVLEVCVVGVPDQRWGEVPKAFVVPRAGGSVTADEIIEFTRDRIAHFKAPKSVEFGDLPKTATGKIQKYILRDKEWQGQERRIQGSQV